MGTYICNCGQVFPEDKLVVKKYDAGYSEGECPSCGSSEDWEEAKQCTICGEWQSKDDYSAGCEICNDCAAAEYTPTLGFEFIEQFCLGAEFYLKHLPFFGCGITNPEAVKIAKAGIAALDIDIESALQEFCLVKYASEWVEFCEAYILTSNTQIHKESKTKHVA